jgi:formiminotetrahydrofolate cyclodeaminase
MNTPETTHALNQVEPPQLLALPTGKLLAKFGSGGHKPGSGSAAALLGLVSCKLVQTVVTLSNGRSEYADVRAQLTLVNQDITQGVEPFLVEAFEKDSLLFNRVIQARRKRDGCVAGSKERKAAAEEALVELRHATELPIAIATRSLELAERALTVFQLGFKSARGDSGVAVSAALSAVHGSLAIVFVNLTSFRGGAWAVAQREAAETLQSRVADLQTRFYQALNDLHQEVIDKERDE